MKERMKSFDDPRHKDIPDQGALEDRLVRH